MLMILQNLLKMCIIFWDRAISHATFLPKVRIVIYGLQWRHSPTHTAYPAWATRFRTLTAVIGGDLPLPDVIRSMTCSDSNLTAIAAFCETIMTQKETAERTREDNLHADPIRCRRTVRRRRVYQGLMPPWVWLQLDGTGFPLHPFKICLDY